MEDKEFILEALKRITPDTSWYGETHADNKSIKNIDILEDMIYFLLSELFEYSIVPAGNKGNGSFEAIAKKKQKVFKSIKEEYFETIEEKLNNKNDNDECKKKLITSLSLFKNDNFIDYEKKECTNPVYELKYFDDFVLKAKNLIASGLYDVAVVNTILVNFEKLETSIVCQQIIKR